MGFYSHGIRKRHPGYELELAFYNWLNENSQYYDTFRWLSYDKKAVFDFFVNWGFGIFIYVDVVNYRYQHRKRRLYTRHKNWHEMLEWAKNDAAGYTKNVRCYLAFPGYNYKDKWSFLRVTEDLPSCDVMLSSHRAKAIRSAEGVFDSVNDRRLRAKLYVQLKKMTKRQLESSKKKLADVDSWIYGDIKLDTP